MIKYLFDSSNRLKSLKSGMEKNTALWENQPDKPDMVQLKIDALTSKEKEIDDIRTSLSIKQSEAHALSSEAESYADRIESIAIGLENSSVEKLNEYGIKLRKTSTKRPIPSQVLIPVLADDSDGVGFVVSTQTDANADIYEWQKGSGTDASKTDTIPEMKLFKTTTKTFFVDDDIPKGVRMFYRVRAVNSVGQGPWSQAVSRVQ